ncbi:MAG: type II toxin-antitoxin system RelE/ParE family toxin [Deinococcota bacterium]
MIQSFRHKGLRRYFETGSTSKIQPNHARKLKLILTLLSTAKQLNDMNFPGSDFHALKGEFADFHAVSVSGNWRVVFRFEDGDAFDVDYLDYH